MKKNLLFIAAYSISFVASSQTYNAGTVLANHTDLSPDTLLHYTYFPYVHQVVDFNIFGTGNDIEFVADGSSSPGGSSAYINIKSLNPNVYISFGRLDSVFDSTSTSWLVTKVAKPLNNGDQINASGAVWYNSMQYISDHSASFGWMKDINDWIGTDKYVGLKYDNGSAVAYGWIRLGCASKDSCFVREYSSSNLSTGIREKESGKVVIYPNPGVGKFIVCFDALSRVEEMDVFDIAGNCIFKKQEIYGIKEEVDLSSEQNGIYFIVMRTTDGIVNRRVVKE